MQIDVSNSLSSTYHGADLAVQRIRIRLDEAQGEIASGRTADPGMKQGADSGSLIQMLNERADLDAFGNSNATVQTRLSAIQANLADMQSNLSDFANSLIGPGNSRANIAAQSESLLSLFTSSMQQTAAGEGLFRSAVPDRAGPQSALANIETRFKVDFATRFGFGLESDQASSITGADLSGFLTAERERLLAPDTPSMPNAEVSSSRKATSRRETVTDFVDTDAPPIRGSLFSIVSVRLLAGSRISDASLGQATKAISAGASMSALALVDMQAAFGREEKSVQRANDQNAMRMQSLDRVIAMMTETDPYKTASEVNALMNQLEASYQMTSKLNSLTLAKFL